MYLKKILLITSIMFMSFSLYSQNKDLAKFFKKVQAKKIKKLNTKISHLTKSEQASIIEIITKYDNKIFEMRKNFIKNRGAKNKTNKLKCKNRLKRVEKHLRIKRKILDFQLKKIEELKTLNIECNTIADIIIFEKKFMRKLRKLTRRKHHQKD